jgi:hypothetical protein
VATKEHKRYAKGLIEGLESRVHLGPPIHPTEIVSAREFLRRSEFSPSSDYHSRLSQLQDQLGSRSPASTLLPPKRNYGGEAAGSWLQVQSAYDHVIVSICYEGEFNSKNGRVKMSHRFNQEGRIDFVELKLLHSLHPLLNGAIRKLITVRGYQTIRKDWRAAEAFVLEVLPQELVFLFQEIFRAERGELFAWLINIGHRSAEDLVKNLHAGQVSGCGPRGERNGEQLCLQAVRSDQVALPILEKAATLESLVTIADQRTIAVSYHSDSSPSDRVLSVP